MNPLLIALGVALLLGCQKETLNNGDVAPLSEKLHRLEFRSITAAVTDLEKHQVRSVNYVQIDNVEYPIDFYELIRTNQKIGSERFGLIKDINGLPMKGTRGENRICRTRSGPDYTSILKFQDNLFAISQFECAIGGAYVMKLKQDTHTGRLSVAALSSVDFSNVNGTYVGCAGVTTAWGTHLGSEEYEPPMALIDNNGVFQKPIRRADRQLTNIANYLNIERTPTLSKHIGYYHGWIPEIAIIDAKGATSVTKHYAMGRFSHEVAYVLPDNKTVYLSDDGSRTGFFMFIADTPKKLNAGTLYAAKWTQQSSLGAGKAKISWINLGHATNREIDLKLKDTNYNFDSMWQTAKSNKDGSCPANFKSTNSGPTGHLCVQLINSEAKVASRMETRLYAAYLGATTEFNKEEGISYDPNKKRLYMAMSSLEKGMENFSNKGVPQQRYDFGGHNDIQLNYNSCGAVYGLDIEANKMDSLGNIIDSQFVVGNMYSIIEGQAYTDSDRASSKNYCDIDKIANPDNLSFLPNYASLLIGEDSGKNEIDSIWSYNTNTKKLSRIFTTPYGAEATSPFWQTDINGFGYITAVVQHPYGEATRAKSRSSEDNESVVGYIGPFPALN